MSGGMYGADIEALRLLADKFVEGSGTLDTVVATVEGTIPQEDGWSGPDAEGFRQEWTGTHLVRLRDTAIALSDIALKVRANADAQETTSNDYAGGPGGTEVAGTSAERPGSVFDVFRTAGAGLGFIMDAKKAYKYVRNLRNLSTALNTAGDAAASATTFIRQGMLADGMGRLGRMGTYGRYMGAAGGVFGVIGGVDQMFNPRYDGWRGGLDRTMGAVGAIGGVASIGMFMGAAAFTGPVGIGIVVGVGLVVGAYELTNLVVDNWDTITAFASDPMPYLADGVKEVKELASNTVDAAKDVASDVGDAVGGAADAVGDFVGGLF